jgi:hypothetical protein
LSEDKDDKPQEIALAETEVLAFEITLKKVDVLPQPKENIMVVAVFITYRKWKLLA